jgi:hypothetical protein
MEIRQALHHLGEIIGQITTDDLLDNIFSKFCTPTEGRYWEVVKAWTRKIVPKRLFKTQMNRAIINPELDI